MSVSLNPANNLMSAYAIHAPPPGIPLPLKIESYFKWLVPVVGAVLSAMLLQMVIGNNNLINRLDERLMNTVKQQEQRVLRVDFKLQRLEHGVKTLQTRHYQSYRRLFRAEQAEILDRWLTERITRLDTQIANLEARYGHHSTDRQ